MPPTPTPEDALCLRSHLPFAAVQWQDQACPGAWRSFFDSDGKPAFHRHGTGRERARSEDLALTESEERFRTIATTLRWNTGWERTMSCFTSTRLRADQRLFQAEFGADRLLTRIGMRKIVRLRGASAEFRRQQETHIEFRIVTRPRSALDRSRLSRGSSQTAGLDGASATATSPTSRMRERAAAGVLRQPDELAQPRMLLDRLNQACRRPSVRRRWRSCS